jgi:hypothetical protein
MTTRKALRSDQNSGPPPWLRTIEEARADIHKGIAKMTDRVMDAISEELVKLGLGGSLGEAEETLRNLLKPIVKIKTLELVRKLGTAPDTELTQIGSISSKTPGAGRER